MGNVIHTVQQQVPERYRRLRDRLRQRNRVGYRPSGTTGYEEYPQDRYKVTHANSGTQMEYHRSTQKYENDDRSTQTEPTSSQPYKPYNPYSSKTTIAFGQTPNRPSRGATPNYAQGTQPQPSAYPQPQGGYPQNTEYPSGGPYQQGYPQPSGQHAYPGQQGGYPPPQGGYGGYPPQQGGYGGYPPQQGGYGGYPPQQGGYAGYPPQQGGYGGYPPQQGYGPPQQNTGAMANKAGMAACIACLTLFFCSCCPGLMGGGMPDQTEGGGIESSGNADDDNN